MKTLCGRLIDCRMESNFAVAFRLQHGFVRQRITIFRFVSSAANRIQEFFDAGGRRIAFVCDSYDNDDSMHVTSVDFGDRGGEVSLGGELDEV